MYGLFTYMKGEKWPHEQGEMAIGKYSHPMDPMGMKLQYFFKMMWYTLTLNEWYIYLHENHKD